MIHTTVVSHWLWNHKFKVLARFTTRINSSLTGIEIEPGATLSNSVIISHGMGTVIGYDSVIANKVVIRQNVTLGRGGKNHLNSTGRIHPIIQDNVSIGAGAAILGSITIGHNAIIGANAVITKDVPPNAGVAGTLGKYQNLIALINKSGLFITTNHFKLYNSPQQYN